VTDPRPDHARFDELAAGYALGALEPEDEWRFRSHASQCDRCRQALTDYSAVAAALAEAAPDVRPDPQLRARILTAAASSPQQPDEAAPQPDEAVPQPDGHAFSAEPASIVAAGPEPTGVAPAEPELAGPITAGPGQAEPADTPLAPVTDLRSRARARRLKIATAAAAVIVAGAGTWGGLAAAGGSSPAATAGCVAASQCTQVVLTAAAGHQVVAGRVVVQGRAVWLRPAALPADDTARQIYVLWQLTGKHTPLAVGSFDVRAGSRTAIRIGTLAAPYSGTLAFAVSLEHGRTIPASPTRQVALGQVPASPDRISRPN
jgi:anti-sigma-K factor RskA